MSRYIDVERLMAKLGIKEECHDCQYNEYGFGFGCLKDSNFIDACEAINSAPSIDICFCQECEFEWTQKCPPHRMGLIHDESDYCSFGIKKEKTDDE